jgi:hypothetical protein
VKIRYLNSQIPENPLECWAIRNAETSFPRVESGKNKAKFRFESLGRNGVRVWHLGNMWVQELA